MSNLAKELFDSLKTGAMAIAPGLKDMGAEIGAELSRLGVHGSMEAASGLINGNAFVPYGPGQYTPTPEQSAEVGHEQPTQEMEHDR
jgi:hypothetical protein